MHITVAVRKDVISVILTGRPHITLSNSCILVVHSSLYGLQSSTTKLQKYHMQLTVHMPYMHNTEPQHTMKQHVHIHSTSSMIAGTIELTSIVSQANQSEASQRLLGIAPHSTGGLSDASTVVLAYSNSAHETTIHRCIHTH